MCCGGRCWLGGRKEGMRGVLGGLMLTGWI